MSALTIPAALALYLQTSAQPFDWRNASCADFVAGWLVSRTGCDPMGGLRRHCTALGWHRAIQARGGWVPLVSGQLGCDPVQPSLAQTGDVVLLPGAITGGTLALCAGRTAVCVDEHGAQVHVPMAEALHAWPLAGVRSW
jgi:hypothetical protein